MNFGLCLRMTDPPDLLAHPVHPRRQQHHPKNCCLHKALGHPSVQHPSPALAGKQGPKVNKTQQSSDTATNGPCQYYHDEDVVVLWGWRHRNRVSF